MGKGKELKSRVLEIQPISKHMGMLTSTNHRTESKNTNCQPLSMDQESFSWYPMLWGVEVVCATHHTHSLELFGLDVCQEVIHTVEKRVLGTVMHTVCTGRRVHSFSVYRRSKAIVEMHGGWCQSLPFSTESII
jgi:hypothetical protein